MNMLQIKIPSSVSGALPKIDELAIDVEITNTTGGTNALAFIFSRSTTIRVVGDSSMYDENDVNLGTSVTIPGSQPDAVVNKIFFHAGKTRLFIPKESLTRIETVGVPNGNYFKLAFSDFSYSKLYACRFVGFDIGESNKFENFDVSETRTFNAAQSNFDDYFENGNFNLAKIKSVSGVKIRNLSSLSGASLGQLNSTDATGQIDVLGSMTGMSYLTLAGNVAGTLESMLDAMVTAGRTSGTLVISVVNTNVTYNGTGLVGTKTATFSGSGWTIA